MFTCVWIKVAFIKIAFMSHVKMTFWMNAKELWGRVGWRKVRVQHHKAEIDYGNG